MAFVPSPLLGLLLLFIASGPGGDCECTSEEMAPIVSCTEPFIRLFDEAHGERDGSCNNTRITSQACGWFGEMLTCIKGTNASRMACLLAGLSTQIIKASPCEVEDFVEVCLDGASIWNFDLTNTTTTTAAATNTTTTAATTTTTTEITGRGGNGFTPFLWMVLVMACLAVLLAVG
ncbi:uncharacterized protein LOC143287381 [Babylonia areolata]|uniref:uncharacterized protein LOC143287381 n=1 Tax=Babylonia areolata TaxID=304850 RepID=UPI003FD246AC